MRSVNIGFSLAAVLVIITWLAGCNNAVSSVVPENAGATSSVALGPIKADYKDALPVSMQLALGLFKLDETGAPVTSEQAAALIPLWKAYRSLTTSGEGSNLEIEALIVQIQETLSQDQQQSIANMQLTMQDLMELAQEKNLVLRGAGGPGLSAEERATREAQRFSGQGGGQGGEFRPGSGMGPPVGMPPGGSGMMPGGEMPPGAMTTPGARQTAVAGRPGSNNMMVSPALVEALITYLETKIP
jgi:hypothetical protein